MKEEHFPVSVINPNETVWQGEAESLSAENSLGRFDILPEHANFVTFLKQDSPITIRIAGGDARVFTYNKAVLAVKMGKVDIYVGI